MPFYAHPILERKSDNSFALAALVRKVWKLLKKQTNKKLHASLTTNFARYVMHTLYWLGTSDNSFAFVALVRNVWQRLLHDFPSEDRLTFVFCLPVLHCMVKNVWQRNLGYMHKEGSLIHIFEHPALVKEAWQRQLYTLHWMYWQRKFQNNLCTSSLKIGSFWISSLKF